MEPMTPEERFTRIENFLNTVAEHQARHAGQMTALTAGLAAQETTHSQEMSELRNLQRAIAGGMIELQQGQRELQQGQREVQQAQRTTEQELKALAESTRELDKAQKITEEKLHILIETVDRIIRDRK
jgi:uncharacterized phage infection (PIP) family protein YhgE